MTFRSVSVVRDLCTAAQAVLVAVAGCFKGLWRGQQEIREQIFYRN